ncbi:hypothetical protein HOLleu_02740 [Holothuria leucospilota]|uniref:Uncharacterized protein n=1 Tax=Holothuria leucospilota TaxID=206669 RepID=A0A9Q1CSM5_HOLLE|nr:hypothetical protein HOLleu_02740 [Holothuria leucospilota]
MTEQTQGYLSKQEFPPTYEYLFPGGHPKQQCYSLSQISHPPTYEMERQNQVESNSYTFEGTRRRLRRQEYRLRNAKEYAFFALCFFPPLGIVAWKKASKVQPLLMAGDYNGAYQIATSAGKWSVASFFCSIIIYLSSLIIILFFLKKWNENGDGSGVNFENFTTV